MLVPGVLPAAPGSPAGSPPSAPDVVTLVLPTGERVELSVEGAERLSGRRTRAACVKDAGDDPDVTDGMTIITEIELDCDIGERDSAATTTVGSPTSGSGSGHSPGLGGGHPEASTNGCIRFLAGEGVGVVARDGLGLGPGEAAINPVPREMITHVLQEVLGDSVSACVTVSAKGGEKVAQKTFNPRLGVEGGISIIGTTGRVYPKSEEAWMRALLLQVDVAVAAGHRRLWLASGGLGEKFAVRELGALPDAVVQCANFVGEVLDRCCEAGVERVVLVGHAGKLVKVAAGVFNTHSRYGDVRLEVLAAVAAAEGAPGPLVARLLELRSVQAAVPELKRAGLTHVWGAVGDRAAWRATERAGLPVDVVMLGYSGELLGVSAGKSASNDLIDLRDLRDLLDLLDPRAPEARDPKAPGTESSKAPETANPTSPKTSDASLPTLPLAQHPIPLLAPPAVVAPSGETVPATTTAPSATTAPPTPFPTAPLVVVGVGPGAEAMLTPEAWREIRSAQVCAGGARLLEAFSPKRAERIVIGGDVTAALSDVREAVMLGKRVVILSSGDPGCFGILAAVRRELPDLGTLVVPGISSVQLAAARLGLSQAGRQAGGWADIAVASVHGRDPSEAVAACVGNPETFVLTGDGMPAQELAELLGERGAFTLTVCERLGYPDERIFTGDAAGVAKERFDALAVVHVRNEGVQE